MYNIKHNIKCNIAFSATHVYDPSYGMADSTNDHDH